jgi:co-chaperonin GroES (HSP10)
MKIKAFKDRILGIMLSPPGQYKETKSGLLIADKDNDASGIKPRWFKIYSVGEEVDFVKEGDYVMVAHGRWSNGVKAFDDSDEKLYLLDNKELLMWSDEEPTDMHG